VSALPWPRTPMLASTTRSFAPRTRRVALRRIDPGTKEVATDDEPGCGAETRRKTAA